MSDEGLIEQKIYTERAQKADAWRKQGINPYGNGFAAAHLAGDLLANHAGKSAQELDEQKPGPFTLAGRVVSLRDFGKAAFIVVQDRSGAIQVHVKKDALGDAAFAAFKLVDVADFVGVKGTVFKSKTGELTIAATELRPLTKALRPLPGKFSKGDDAEAKAWAEKQALADVEERYRRRYVDLLSNPGVRETFKKRTKLVQFIRHFLDERDFLEVETPMMHPLVSGAAARPFITHHNTLDLKLYMRIAPELYLKRLVVGGFDRVYEINRNFRNEGISTKHNPEFTMLEFYQAYATYEDLMDLTEELISQACVAVTGGSKVQYGPDVIDFKKGWPRIPMIEAIRQKVSELSEKDFGDPDKLKAVAKRRAEGEKEKTILDNMNVGELIGALFEQHVEGELVQPTFITQFPVETSPLARRNDANPAVTDRFELFCVRREIANAFSELNDPIDQEQRFRAQLDAKARGQEETMDYDADYIRALEHGLPPTAGEGIGIDRLAMLFTDAHSIRDVILFPLLKPQATK
ncbi:MAG: lysine--tRNA ligase [Myxococcales bacterium]|nr:lysine--tRNA ligase [Myxococcales bacterium]